MSLLRQGRSFLIIGFIQLVADSAITIALSRIGLALEAANIIGRVCGAMFGFWLNGRFTFSGHDFSLGRPQMQRFIAAWLLLTTIGTLTLGQIERNLDLRSAWLAKPLIETTLAIASFFLSRHWIYRRT